MMSIANMYLSSADWLKTMFVLAPWFTIYSVARIWGHVRLQSFLPRHDDPDYLAYREMKLRERLEAAEMERLRG